jgi:hypothetical protein
VGVVWPRRYAEAILKVRSGLVMADCRFCISDLGIAMLVDTAISSVHSSRRFSGHGKAKTGSHRTVTPRACQFTC